MASKKTKTGDFIKSMIESGYNKAADSFSSLLGVSVTCDNYGITVLNSPEQVPEISKSEEPLTVVTTEIKGKLEGKSYLIMDQQECDQVYTICMKAKAPETMLLKEFLKELDNILSAAVITEISNTLELEIYGDVPHILTTEAKTVKNMVAQDFTWNKQADAGDNYIVTSIRFRLACDKMCQPQFVWKLDNTFLSQAYQTSGKRLKRVF